MRFRSALSIATLFLICFTVAVWGIPVNAVDNALPDEGPRTLMGKIASVGDAEFTMEVKQDQHMLKIKFIVDGNTKVEGKLVIGSQATVEYRSESGNNLAAHVTVIPASGLQAF